MPKLLQAMAYAATTSTEGTACGQDAMLFHISALFALAVDAAASDILLNERVVSVLLEAAMDAPGMGAALERKVAERLPLGTDSIEASPKDYQKVKLLKRRRIVQVVGCSDGVPDLLHCARRTLDERILKSVDAFERVILTEGGAPSVDAGMLALLALRRCLRRSGACNGRAAFSTARRGNFSASAAKQILVKLAPKFVSGKFESRLDARRFAVLLQVIHSCIANGATEITSEPVLPCREVVAKIDAILAITHSDGDHGCNCEFGSFSQPIAVSCLQLLQALVQRHSSWADLAMTTDEPLLNTLINILANPFLPMQKKESYDTTNFGSACTLARTVLDVLASAAATASGASASMHALSSFPVHAGFSRRLLSGALAVAIPTPQPETDWKHDGGHAITCGATGPVPFAGELCDAFAVRHSQFFTNFESSDMNASTDANVAEIRLRIALSATLLGWIVHSDAHWRAAVAKKMGSTNVLTDVLRQYTVFLERSGALTDSSIVRLFALMRSVEVGPSPN